MLVLLSGALGLEAGFFELQTVNAVEVIQNGSPEVNRSSETSREETLEQTVKESSLEGFFSKEGFSKEALSPARKKLSTDLLRLRDEHYLPSGDTSGSFRGRMVRFGQLRPAVSSSASSSFSSSSSNTSSNTSSELLVNSEVSSGSGDGDAGEKVHVYVYLEASASTHVLDPYCELETRDEANKIATAWVPVDALETLASLPEVRGVRTVIPPVTRSGRVSTEGDSILNSSTLRDLYGVSGAGIKIGIISDGVDSLADAVASGDLPDNVTVLRNVGGEAEGEDEGTAMLEIVHDIAPGAELYFHDCGDSRYEFNAAIDALVDAGCKVVCDDIGWLGEPYFEDGVVASHVAEVIKTHDILYVSSAGNAAESHYQGMFYDAGNGWHDFSGGRGDVKNLRLNISPSEEVWVFLEWDDPWRQSGNDYDLYLIDENSSEIIMDSIDTQDGNGLPLEYVLYSNEGRTTLDASVRVLKKSGEARELELYIFYARDIDPSYLVAEDSIFGHPAVPEAVAVGAIAADDPGYDDIENFSSRGPVTIAYPTPETRLKTDVVGIDGVSVTGAGGFGDSDGESACFSGTSASAPHVAAVAGLVWSVFPEKSAADIRGLLYSSAVDSGDPGYDPVFGYGRADALRMYEQAAAEPRAFDVDSGGGGDFLSLSDAVAISKPGDTFLVFPGTYPDNVDVPWNLTICSASGNPEDTVIEAADPGKPVFHVHGNASRINGLGIRGSGRACGVYLEGVRDCTLSDNLISDCGPGVWLEGSFNNTLSGNNISNNTEGLRLAASFLNRIHENEFGNTYNINDSLTEPLNESPAEEEGEEGEEEDGLSNFWNTSSELAYLYKGDVYSSRLGNFYSDYGGADPDGNGIGELPYGSDPYPLMERLSAYNLSFSLGGAVPGKAPFSIEGDVLEFEIRSTRSCNFSWMLNGLPVQANASAASAKLTVNTSEVLESVGENNPSTPFIAGYNVTVLAETGSKTLTQSWDWTVFPTEEERDRIERIVVSAPFDVGKNSSVSFNFTAGEVTESRPGEYSVYCISFYSLEASGNVSARLELLSVIPSSVQETPFGDPVYSYLNIGFDNSSISGSEKILNRTIAFRVLKSWVAENDINPASISLQRYHNGTWKLLDVTKEREDESYLYFKAETPVFSSFAVTASRNVNNSSGESGIGDESDGNGGSSGSGGSVGSGGVGSGGGGGGSPEPASNVESKELAQTFITNGKRARFDFTRNATPVDYVVFDPKKSAGKTTTIVEMLKNRSVLVSGLPDGEVYRHMNIWVGNSGFATPRNIENAAVGFRVEKNWFSEEGIDPDSVLLYRYANESWTRLQTEKCGEDEEFFYFESKTSGFSPFAVTGREPDVDVLYASVSSNETGDDLESETEPDGASGIRITREGPETGLEEEGEEGGVVPAPGIGVAMVLLLAGAVYRKKR
ncbi:MAG: PGF-pre-PGF domain-containing protein [Methanosarcinaceae archaeon]